MFIDGPTAAAKPGDSLERSLVATAGALSAALVSLCGIVLVCRRAGGGFGPVGGVGLFAGAALGAVLVVSCDAAVRGVGLPAAWRGVARTGYLLTLAALAFPPRPGSGLDGALFVAAAALGGALVAEPLVRAGVGPWLHRPGPGGTAATPRARIPTSVASPGPGNVRQRLERYELDGMDILRGTLTLTVPPGSRMAHGHVGFCPSFRQVPQVEASTAYDGVEAVVTAAEVVPWGLRVECRLDEPAEEVVEIPVDVVAQAPA